MPDSTAVPAPDSPPVAPTAPLPTSPTTPSDAPSTASPTPEDLFRYSLRLLLAADIPGWIALWADDGTMEFPFAPPDRPSRLDGKEAIAGYMRGYPDHIELHDLPDLRIHRTADPDVIVVEMRAVGRLVQTNAPYEMTYVAVVTARDGQFVSYRDYWNPLLLDQPGTAFHESRS